jgi:hypothetical protein
LFPRKTRSIATRSINHFRTPRVRYENPENGAKGWTGDKKRIFFTDMIK